MQPIERLPIEIFSILFGLVILFMPYIFSGLWVSLTDNAAKTNPKIPQDPKVRLKWIVKNTFQGMWPFFAIIGSLMLYDVFVLLSNPVNAPPLPAELRQLPTKATTIGCPGESRPPGIVHVYELPGLTPKDNSGGNGDRGKDLFVLPYCEEVQVIAYAWSETDHTYYLLVQLKDGREGWAWATFVNIR